MSTWLPEWSKWSLVAELCVYYLEWRQSKSIKGESKCLFTYYYLLDLQLHKCITTLDLCILSTISIGHSGGLLLLLLYFTHNLLLPALGNKEAHDVQL